MTFDKKRNGTFMNVSVPSNKNLIHLRAHLSWEGRVQTKIRGATKIFTKESRLKIYMNIINGELFT